MGIRDLTVLANVSLILQQVSLIGLSLGNVIFLLFDHLLFSSSKV